MRVRTSARSHVGLRREVNQDAYSVEQPGAATLLIVCDGMGGHLAGEVASTLAVDTISASFRPADDPAEALRSAFTAANDRVYGEGHGSMGTTAVAALLLHNQLYVANVGDSRAYLIREGQITQISHDHSFVSDQVAAGLMTPDEARASNVRNIITRALGHSAEVTVDLFSHDLRPGDTVLLSTDGMHGLITDAEIAEIASMFPPEQAAQQLVDRANERGGIDNITVVIAQVDQLDEPVSATPAAAPGASDSPLAPPVPTERPLSRLGLTLAALTLVLLVGVGGLLWAAPGGTRAPAVAPAAPTPTPALPSPTMSTTPAIPDR